MSDWDASDSESKPAAAAAPAAPKVVLPKKSKFAGEDEGDKKEDSDDWDASSASESENVPVVAASSAPTKKKGTLKAKLAEKERLAAERAAGGLNSDDDPMLEMTPQEKRRIQRQQEIDADIANAADLLGESSLSSDPLASLPFTPVAVFSQQVFSQVIAKHTSHPLYNQFLTEHLKTLVNVDALKDSDVRKLAAALSTIANEKQQAARAAKNGKGAKKGGAKPGLGGNKSLSTADTRVYEDALDDGDDDFM